MLLFCLHEVVCYAKIITWEYGVMFSKEDINEFIVACDNMSNSKFILVDKRIGEVLKSVATTKPVYNCIAENMINFNFSGAWAYATSKTGEFSIPEGKLVGFVFCMLKAINDGKININDCLIKHFPSSAEDKSSYALFCDQTIVPFKNQIVEILCSDNKKKVVVSKLEPKKDNLEAQVMERLVFLAKDIKAYVIGLKKIKGCPVAKQDYINLVDALLCSFENKNRDYYLVFVQTLLSLCGKDRELKQRIESIKELLKEEM